MGRSRYIKEGGSDGKEQKDDGTDYRLLEADYLIPQEDIKEIFTF